MTRVIAQLGDHPDLYALETELPADRLEVTFFDDGEPKPVETLSKVNGRQLSYRAFFGLCPIRCCSTSRKTI